jgi:asparagine synthase (glutamine-hydrolysing)
MRADVPVGFCLSGGIDSSAVVAALAACGHRLRSFSVVFGERQFDESMHSRQIAQHFGTEHTELLLHPEQVLEDLDEALAAYDQPSIDGVNTYFISRATRQAGVKVALSGIGGDELFAGYPYFRWLAQLERPGARRFAQLAHWLLRRLAPESTRTTKLGALLQQRGSRLARYAVCRQVMAADRREALLGDNGALLMALPDELREQLEKEVTGLDAVNAHSRLELGLYLANMLLRDLDQMSMAHALEVREPLLDHVLVETVAQLPGAWKLDPGRQRSNKGLLVDALPEGLPDRVLHRKKMGFVFPWERWLRRELKNFVAGVFVDIETLEAVGLDHIAVQRLWQDFLAARPGVRYTDILCLLHLLRWVRRHRLEARQMAQDCYR